MTKRLLLILSLALLPVTVTAEDPPVTDPTPTAETTTPTTAPGDGTATANGLGPESTGGAGSSTGASSALQPAGQAPLQSTTEDSTGLSAPANALQAPVASEAQLQVLAGEADGNTHEPDGEADAGAAFWNWLAATLILAALLTGVAIVLRDRRRFGRSDPSAH